jgi:hypothetical protein
MLSTTSAAPFIGESESQDHSLIGLALSVFHVHHFRLILTLLFLFSGDVLLDETHSEKAFDLEILKVSPM